MKYKKKLELTKDIIVNSRVCLWCCTRRTKSEFGCYGLVRLLRDEWWEEPDARRFIYASAQDRHAANVIAVAARAIIPISPRPFAAAGRGVPAISSLSGGGGGGRPVPRRDLSSDTTIVHTFVKAAACRLRPAQLPPPQRNLIFVRTSPAPPGAGTTERHQLKTTTVIFSFAFDARSTSAAIYFRVFITMCSSLTNVFSFTPSEICSFCKFSNTANVLSTRLLI